MIRTILAGLAAAVVLSGGAAAQTPMSSAPSNCN